jgi:hypothetical protein
MKKDLLNSIEMLLSADIIDAQTYTKLVQKVSLFNEALPKLEAPRVRENEEREKVCLSWCNYNTNNLCTHKDHYIVCLGKKT